MSVKLLYLSVKVFIRLLSSTPTGIYQFRPRYVYIIRYNTKNTIFIIFFLHTRFREEVGRHNYVTPTSYLELISAFKKLLTQKRAEVRL